MKITISEIAKLANVSKSAVSIVLNNKKGVSEKTRAHVLEIIKEYNFNPNSVARSLAANKTKVLGLVIKEIDNPYFAKVMKGVYKTSAELGYSVLLGSSELYPERESEIIDALLSKRVDGLLVSPLRNEEANFTYLTDLIRDTFPLVLLGTIDNYKTNSVDIDNFKAAYDAVSYLIELGHRKIAHFGGPIYSEHGKKRLEGYKQALIDRKIPIERSYVLSVEPYIPSGFKAGIKLFSKNPEPPSAVFCYNDLVSIGLLNALLELNIKVPEQVSIIGFDNIDFSSSMKIPLSTVNMPAYEIGISATNLLIKQINSSVQLNKKKIVKHRLIIRNSCSEHIE